MFPYDFPSDLRGIADMPIPAVDQQGDLVIAALVITVILTLYLRFRHRRRAY
jgi:hypothetical protein